MIVDNPLTPGDGTHTLPESEREIFRCMDVWRRTRLIGDQRQRRGALNDLRLAVTRAMEDEGVIAAWDGPTLIG